MCGRFTLRTPASQLVEIFDLLRTPDLQLRFNIAPTQPVAVIRQTDEGREPSMLHWGMIPSWAKDPSIGSRMINARGETVATKPSFRSAFRRRRCLIMTDGFYEWKKTGGKTKQPYYIGRADDQPFAFAGLWEFWSGADASAIESCTIITTKPNELLSEIHDRMPVILQPDDYDRWLDPAFEDKDELQSLLVANPADEMAMRPVSTIVNNPRNERPECLDPFAIGDE